MKIITSPKDKIVFTDQGWVRESADCTIHSIKQLIKINFMEHQGRYKQTRQINLIKLIKINYKIYK